MSTPFRVFVSYSHEDDWISPQVLTPLKEKHFTHGDVRIWWDKNLNPGVRWESEIRKEIDSANLCLLFISNDFVVSDYIRNIELPRIRERAEDGPLLVLPVMASPLSKANRKAITWLLGHQVYPSDQMTLLSMRDDGPFKWVSTLNALADLIMDYRERPVTDTELVFDPAAAARALPGPTVAPPTQSGPSASSLEEEITRLLRPTASDTPTLTPASSSAGAASQTDSQGTSGSLEAEIMELLMGGGHDTATILLDRVAVALGNANLNEADQASLAYLRAVSGTDSFDTKEKVELIPGPALRKLNSAWEVLGKGALGRRDWIRLSKPGVTTYKALFSLTTWLQQRMKDLSID